MNRTEYIGKLNALYVGEKNCLEELITIYDEKDKEIERLNNIINELEKYIHNELVLDFYNDDMPCELIISKMENMIKKLKGSDKE